VSRNEKPQGNIKHALVNLLINSLQLGSPDNCFPEVPEMERAHQKYKNG